MIACIRDDNGDIQAVCEWLKFDNRGNISKEGRTLFIGEMEVNKAYYRCGLFKEMCCNVFKMAGDFEKVFWLREYKYKGREPKLYTKEQIARRIGIYGR